MGPVPRPDVPIQRRCSISALGCVRVCRVRFLYAGFHGLILMDKVQTGTVLYSLAVLAAADWFWRQVRRLDRGLLAPVLGHMAADLSILLAVFWKVSRWSPFP